jgi:hypothetical protein
MPNVFISYSRENMAIAEAIANDIRALGHNAWFDQELTGGQAWWDQILTSVRNCDVFVFVLTPQSLSSTACMREYGYAATLRKPIMPILVADGVSTNLLPPALSQIQFIDWRNQNRSSALRLARALATISPPGPLPDPLPKPPDVPISYLGGLTEQIETHSVLSYEQQSALVVDLKRGLRDPETVADSQALLARLRRRRDLLATIAEEIDELLKGVTKETTAAPVAAAREPASAQQPNEERSYVTEGMTPERREPQRTGSEVETSLYPIPALRERVTFALCGALVGTAVGVGAMVFSRESWMMGFLTGAGVAVAGAISGRRMQIFAPAMFGAAVVWSGFVILNPLSLGAFGERFAAGAVLAAPAGATLGATAAAIFFRRLRSRPKPASGSAMP